MERKGGKWSNVDIGSLNFPFIYVLLPYDLVLRKEVIGLKNGVSRDILFSELRFSHGSNWLELWSTFFYDSRMFFYQSPSIYYFIQTNEDTWPITCLILLGHLLPFRLISLSIVRKTVNSIIEYKFEKNH